MVESSKPPDNAPADTLWIPCAAQGEMVEVGIFLFNVSIPQDNWPGRNAMRTGFVGRMPQEHGGEVVVVHRTREMWRKLLYSMK